MPASPAISFSLLLPHRASFRHVLPRPHINTQVPRSTPPSRPRKPCVKCQKSGSAHRPGIHQVSKSSERAAGKVERQGWPGARDKRKKAPAPPQGISQGVCSLGEIMDACSGWSRCIFSYIGQRDTDKDLPRRLTT